MRDDDLNPDPRGPERTAARPPSFAYDLAAVFDQLHDSVGVYDRAGHILHLNDAAAHFFRRPAHELIGRRLSDVRPDHHGFLHAFERAALTGDPELFDHHDRLLDRHFEVHIHAVGDVVFVLARDVTRAAIARRRLDALAELTALAQATRPRTFDDIAEVTSRGLDADVCCISLLDADGALRVQGFHDRLAEAADERRGDPALGTETATATVLERGRALLIADLDDHSDGHGKPDGHNKSDGHAKPDGHAHRGAAGSGTHVPAPTSLMFAPLCAGGRTIGVLGVGKRMRAGHVRYTEADLAVCETFADRVALVVDHAREARERLRLERRLATLTDVLPALVAFVDTDERYRFVSGRYREWLGLEPATLLGKHPRDVLGAANYEHLRPHVARVLAGEDVTFDTTLAYPGGERSVRAHYAPVRDPDGKIEGYAALVLDVSSDVAETLRREALLREVAAARAAAESAGRAKDEFLALLGHELRNPLAPIRTALDLMTLRAPDTVVKERAVIERQVRHLARMVDDLLDVARIAQGKIEIKAAPLRIRDVLASAIEMASPLIESRHHTLDIRVPDDGLIVHGDEDRLAQVFANLLRNAARYTNPGGHLTLSAEARDGHAVIRVGDDGVGISPELLPKVFDLFVQGLRDSARAEGGLGLGLAIVRSLVTLHGGTVAAHSDGLGRGSTFEVRLPLRAAGPAAADPRAAATSGLIPSQTRILVVDDNRDAAEMLAEALGDAGFSVEVAHDGPSALTIAEAWRPNIALLDIGLPVMDGFELAARLRELPAIAPLRIVAVTGYGQAADRERVTAAGFTDHLVKPVSLEHLLNVISS